MADWKVRVFPIFVASFELFPTIPLLLALQQILQSWLLRTHYNKTLTGLLIACYINAVHLRAK